MFEDHTREPIFLCFFDVLGTSKLIERGELEKVYSLYEYVTNETEGKLGRACFGAEPVGDGTVIPCVFTQNVYSDHFSDTFIMWSNYDGSPRFPPFLDTCMNVFCEALANGVPLRGCVSIGEAIMDLSTKQYVGLPLSESAKGEVAQNWLGFTAGRSFLDAPSYDARHYIPWAGHLKESATQVLTPLCFDWPRWWRENRPAEDAVAAIQRMNTDERFSSYYDNAAAFVAHSAEHSEWWIEAKLANARSPEEFERLSCTWLTGLQ